MPFDAGLIRRRIKSVAESEAGLTSDVADEVAFHLTDWLDDLAALNKLYEDPEALPAKDLDRLLLGFLTHVPNHLAAAAKLYADIPVTDVFNVGAIDASASS